MSHCCPFHAGVAFMLVSAQEFPENPEETDLFERIKKFMQIHKNGFILLLSSLHGKKEWDLLSTIQHRYMIDSTKYHVHKMNMKLPLTGMEYNENIIQLKALSKYCNT